MSSISNDQLLQQLKWRYATKAFDASKVIPEATWKALEEALILTPSSFGLQPWKFIVVTNKETREKLLPASWKQTQTVAASHFVVFATKTSIDQAYLTDFLSRTAAARGETLESPSIAGYGKMITGFVTAPGFPVQEWATRQVYIALGNLMTSAALLGIDTCPMEGINPAAYDEILGLKDSGYATVVACAAGYRAETDKYASIPKVRFAPGEVIEYK
ncbi:NAD(P)H-dependent oxidoreductase [Verrucomicrobia bacterium LW23]|nr:NAD(P)H-dependent oxidoreductase [Verrucomicrobia bacterium LW23]